MILIFLFAASLLLNAHPTHQSESITFNLNNFKIGAFTLEEDDQIISLCNELSPVRIWLDISEVMLRDPQTLRRHYARNLQLRGTGSSCTVTKYLAFTKEEDDAILEMIAETEAAGVSAVWSGLSVRFGRTSSSLYHRYARHLLPKKMAERVNNKLEGNDESNDDYDDSDDGHDNFEDDILIDYRFQSNKLWVDDGTMASDSEDSIDAFIDASNYCTLYDLVMEGC